MWDWIVNILFELLKLIQTFAVDWGLSIIILVVIIRLLLTPLMLKSTKSTARMQVLQPKMLEIQERYADDPQRQAEEMQKFYSENKFNPLAGCLPLLIQMPILIALFTLLRNLPTRTLRGHVLVLQHPARPYHHAERFLCRWLYGRAACADLADSVRCPDPDSAAVYVAQSDRPAGLEHAHHVRRHVRHDALDGLEPSRRRAALLRCLHAWQVVQQMFVTRHVMEKAKAEEEARLANAPIEVDVVRRERKARPHKKN